MLENIRPDVTLHHEAMSTQEVVAQKTQLQPELGSRALKLVEIERQEQERQRNISQNANRIKKRFGETFVKGEKLQDGGYAGGAARELLADYMEKSNFSDELKRLIPNKHGALDTLRDNQDYIRHQLAVLYADNEAVEKDVPQDPYELAQIASYELSGPFNSVDEFIDRKNDFRSHEVLCTFNSPQHRLDGYHIMWLRHDSADSTLPADELTEENLNEPWKNHLRQTGRYDEITNKYDLADLSPTREDPYGVSSMSVQVSRTGNHVSVKNRYNHTVGSPDSTYKNDLDNLVPGLRLATYHKVDRDDLMYEDLELGLQEGYVLDNDSGIHKYLVEYNNFYLGDYEYVENGEVTTIDRGKYDMLSPRLYLKKDTSGEAITVAYDEDIRTEFEVLDSGAKKVDLYIDKQLQSTYVYVYGDDQPPKIELKVYKYDLVSDNPALTSLTIAEGASTGYIINNPALTSLTIAEGASTGGILDNPALTNLAIAEGASTGYIENNLALTNLTIAEGATTSLIADNPALTNLTIAEGASTRYIVNNLALTNLTIAEGATTGGIENNLALTNLTIAEGASVSSIRFNLALTNLTIAEGASTVGIKNNPALTNLTIAEGATTGGIENNPALFDLAIAEGASTRHILDNLALTNLTIAEGATTGGIENNPALTNLTIAEGASTGGIQDNPALTNLTIAEGASVSSIRFNLALTNLTIAEGASTVGIKNNPALTNLTIAEGATTGGVENNPALTNLTIAEGATTGGIENNLALFDLIIAEGASTGDIVNNPALAEPTIYKNVTAT